MRPGFFTSVSVLVLLTLVPGVASAAFEFVAPSARPAPVASPAQNQVQPQDSSAPVIRTPVTDLVDTLEQAPLTAPLDAIQPEEAPVNQRANIPLAPIQVPLTPVVRHSDALSVENDNFDSRPASRSVSSSARSAQALPDPVALPSASRVSGGNYQNSATIQGFGRGVPLAIALQQIVPASYRYSFEPPINPSMRINWSGDKPWKEVVADIARNNDMNVDIASNVIAFSRHKPLDMIDAGLGFGTAAPLATSPAALPAPITAPVRSPAHSPAHSEAPVPAAAPVMADAAPAPTLMAGPSDISDLIYDGPNTRPAFGHSPSAPSAAPMPLSAPAVNEAVITPPPVSGQRTALASISDTPLEPVDLPPAMPAPARMPASASANTSATPSEPKSAFFDGLLDQGNPAQGSVKDKKILTTDDAAVTPNIQVAESKPMDILDPKPMVAHTPPKPSSQSPGPATTASVASLPPIMGNDPTHIGKPIDNDPVAAFDLPLPGAPGAAAPVTQQYLPNVEPDLATTQEWIGLRSQTLRQTLTAWAEQAGTSLVWSSEYDYPLQTDVRIQAGYTDAVRTLLDGFSKAQPRPIGRLFKNDKVGAQPVLIIETQRLTH